MRQKKNQNPKQSLLLLVCFYYLTSASSLLAEEADAPLGRLFYSPSEREALDAQRRRGSDPETLQQIREQQVLPERLEINGVVLRSNGERTVWINHQRRLKQPGLRIQTEKMSNLENIEVPIFIIDGQQHYSLKPGQYLDTHTKKIQESYKLPNSKQP